MTLEAQLLVAAAALVARGWSRDSPAADETGAPVQPASLLARRWSALGALEAVSQHRRRASPEPDRVTRAFDEASLALRAVTGRTEAWNRADGRAQEDVIAAFEQAIRLCEHTAARSQPLDAAAM
jgi:hypothetical protein